MDQDESQDRFYRTRIAELALLATTTSDPGLRIELLVMAKRFHKLADYVANENAQATRAQAGANHRA